MAFGVHGGGQRAFRPDRATPVGDVGSRLARLDRFLCAGAGAAWLVSPVAGRA
jgi:hypothetical protein